MSPVGDTTAATAARAGSAYENDPRDPNAAIAYGRSLRELGSPREATLVLARTLAENPHHAELLAEYGKALTADGRPAEALPVFAKAERLKPGDWSFLSAEGIALDGTGKHDEARIKYKAALKLSPDNPDVLANLGLSLALSGQLDDAETTLRRAVTQSGANSQTRQNLALVLGLRGRFGEAERLARADLDPKTAQNNVATMRQMFDKPAKWADARDAAASVATNTPETSPAPIPTVARVDPLGSGLTGATRAVAPPAASSEPKRRVKPLPPLGSNGIDETFFGFPW